MIEDRKFSKPGDSGSTVQNASGQTVQTVGLLYAGSKTSTIVNPIADVETALGLTIK